MNITSARAHCSSANIGSGFDSFGICHDAFHVDGTITINDPHKPFEAVFNGNSKNIDDIENSAVAVVRKMALDIEIKGKFTISFDSSIPVGMGLGSSGAASVCSAILLNRLFDLKLSEKEIITYASHGENFAAGSYHLDNVAASTLGNFSAVFSDSPLRIRNYPISGGIKFLAIVPYITARNKTMENRKLIPEAVPFSSTVNNVKFSTSLIAGILTGDRDLVEYGLNDNIVEVARTSRYPFFPEIRSICQRNKAIGLILSGSGPAMLCFTDEKTDVKQIQKELDAYFKRNGLDFITSISYPTTGAYERN